MPVIVIPILFIIYSILLCWSIKPFLKAYRFGLPFYLIISGIWYSDKGPLDRYGISLTYNPHPIRDHLGIEIIVFSVYFIIGLGIYSLLNLVSNRKSKTDNEAIQEFK